MEGKCKKCGEFRKALHRDHIKPKSLGGSDRPSNIQWLCANCHQTKTNLDMRRIWNAPKFRARMKAVYARPEVQAAKRAGNLRGWSIPGRKDAMSKRVKTAWNQPGQRKKWARAIARANRRPEVQSRRIATLKTTLMSMSPEAKRRRSENTKLALNRPEVRVKLSIAQKKAWAKPGARARRSAISRKVWTRPDVKHKWLASMTPKKRRAGALLGHQRRRAHARRTPWN